MQARHDPQPCGMRYREILTVVFASGNPEPEKLLDRPLWARKKVD